MNRILITGVTGFVGRSLVSHFQGRQDVRLYGYSRNPDAAREAFHESGDPSTLLRSAQDRLLRVTGEDGVVILPKIQHAAMDQSGIDTVVHLAGIAHDLSGKYKEADYMEGNLQNTIRLYEQFTASAATTFIFLSSIKAIADHTDELLDESYVPRPETPYGKSKLLAEQYLLEHPVPGKRIVILRPCMIHGPGNKGNLNLLYSFVKTGLPWPLAAFQNRRSFLSVANLCFIIEKIIDNPAIAGTFLLADDEPLATSEIVKLIGKATGRSPKMFKIPVPLMRALATVGTALHLPFNRATLGKLTENMEVSNRKLLLTLGAELPVSAREGLMLTIKSLNG